MNQPDEFTHIRAAMLDADHLVRALASGRRKGQPAAEVGGRQVRRVEVRVVDLKAGPHLQVTSYDATQAHTLNYSLTAPAGAGAGVGAGEGAEVSEGTSAEDAIDALLAQPFAHWHVDTTTETHQVRVTKKGAVLAHTDTRDGAVGMGVQVDRDHDRGKDRLLASDDPVLKALGISDAQGRIKPTRQAKYRQVEEFLRLLDASLSQAMAQGHLRVPTPAEPLRIVDLGCGNAYLTFAAHRYLSTPVDRGGRGLAVHVTGVDVKQQSADHNTAVASGLGIDAEFVVGSIGQAQLERAPDVVLALHACDTATDDALARALEWEAALVLAAPCCHHDIAAQLRVTATPPPYAMLTRHGILRERFADTLTDALRATLLRREGYRVDAVEFVESAHTPRNTLLRAIRTGKPGQPGESGQPGQSAGQEYDDLLATWGVRPRLGELLGSPPGSPPRHA